MVKPVVLLAKQRTGTSYLRHLLKPTSQFVDCHEILHTEIYKTRNNKHRSWDQFNYYTFRTRRFEENILLSIPLQENIKFIFKKYLKFLKRKIPKGKIPLIDIKYNSIHHFNATWQEPLAHPYLFDLLVEHKIPLIHLVRKNLFNTYLSFEVAKANQKWILFHDEDFKFQKIVVDTDQMLTQLQNTSKEIELFRAYVRRQLGKQSIELVYEKILSIDGFRKHAKPKIEELVGISLPSEFETKTVKIVNNTEKMISNYDEVMKALKNSEFSHFVTLI